MNTSKETRQERQPPKQESKKQERKQERERQAKEKDRETQKKPKHPSFRKTRSVLFSKTYKQTNKTHTKSSKINQQFRIDTQKQDHQPNMSPKKNTFSCKFGPTNRNGCK